MDENNNLNEGNVNPISEEPISTPEPEPQATVVSEPEQTYYTESTTAPVNDNTNESPDPLNVAALVCGIIGIVSCWIPVIGKVGILVSIAAIVLGTMGKDKPGFSPYGKAGKICGIVGVVLFVISMLLALAAGALLFGLANEVTGSSVDLMEELKASMGSM